MARRAQTVIQRKREELISLSTIHLLSPGKGGGGKRGGEGFWGSHGFQSKGISRKNIKRGGGGLIKLTANRLLMKRDRTI